MRGCGLRDYVHTLFERTALVNIMTHTGTLDLDDSYLAKSLSTALLMLTGLTDFAAMTQITLALETWRFLTRSRIFYFKISTSPKSLLSHFVQLERQSILRIGTVSSSVIVYIIIILL